MKKLLCLLLCVLFLFPAVSLSEFPLSSNEQNYVGAWSLYADNGKGTIYSMMITFLDSMEVVQSSMTFKDGTLVSNNKASGEWCTVGNTSEHPRHGLPDCGVKKDRLWPVFFCSPLLSVRHRI